MSRRLLLILTLLAAGTLGLGAQVTSDRLLRADQEPQNWLTYSGGYQSQRHSLLRQIDPTNAKRLQQAWVFQSGASLQNFEATPLVVDGVMYFTQPINDVVALDAKTGRVFWVFRHNLPNDIKPCCGSVNRGVAVLGNRVFYGTLDGQLIALDVGKQELLRKIRQDADAVDPLVDHAIGHAPLPVEVHLAGVGEGSGGNRQHAAQVDVGLAWN